MAIVGTFFSLYSKQKFLIYQSIYKEKETLRFAAAKQNCECGHELKNSKLQYINAVSIQRNMK
jgi:hypothetical protein